MDELAQDSNFKNKYITYKHWSPPSPLGEIPIEGIKGTPLFDLSRLKMSFPGSYIMKWDWVGDKNRLEYLEIYGHIFLIDDKGNEFAFFYRDFDNAEKVPLDIEEENVKFTLHKFLFDSPRCLARSFCLVFYLKEKSQDVLILDQVKFVDTAAFELNGIYDSRLFLEIFPDLLTSVYVEYTILQSALLACVGVIIEKVGGNETHKSDDLYAAMTGTLKARFLVREGYFAKHVLSNSHSFHKFGNFSKLSIFGVPAYSVLHLSIDVEVNGEKFQSFDNYLEFDPDDTYQDIPYEKELLGKKFRLRILVKWGHANFFLREAKLCEWLDRTRSKVIEDLNWEEGEDKSITESRLFEKCKKRFRCINQNNFQPISIHPRLEALGNREWIMSSFPEMLVEVFSITVCPYGQHAAFLYSDSDTLDLYGTINVKHAYGTLRMFHRAEKNPKHLESYEPIPLISSFDRCIEGPNFSMKIDLKDRVRSQICNGYVAYNFHTVGNWLNKRLCSTIRGESGFATVHHTIFADAVQAKLKFILKSNFGVPINGLAFGRINGRYANFRYDTHYDKKFFQITLFDKEEARPVKIVSGEIPLSKHVVVVPLNGALVVTAFITVLIQGGCEALKYTYEATFNPVKPEDSRILLKKVQGSNFNLSMFVEWG